MNIFENLENLNVSEECFNDIMSIVEDLLHDAKAIRRNAETALKRKEVELKNLQKQKETAPKHEVPAMNNQINKVLSDTARLLLKANRARERVDWIAGK